jgi:predicted phage terminase large subunit-like protein
MEYPAMRRKLLELAGKWNASQVIVEKTGAGISLIQEIRRYKTFRLRWHRPQTDKATRLMSVSPFIEAGLVYLQKNAPWLEILHDEVVKFPKAKHDDIVDSLAQYLIWVEKVAPGRW